MSRFLIGDVVEYDYTSGGYWRTVQARIEDTDDDCYIVRILAVIEGEDKLSNGTKIVGKIRSPRRDWVDKRANLISCEVGSDLPPTASPVYEEESLVSASTLDELYKKFELDPTRWDVSRITVESSDFGQKVWARFFPKDTGIFRTEKWQEDFLEKVKNLSPVQEPHPTSPQHLLSEINLSDLHFRMLAWGVETGADYDISIASKVTLKAGLALVRKSVGLGVHKIVLASSGDLFHSDGSLPFTKKSHNLLDVDSRFPKAFDALFNVFVSIVDVATIDYKLPVEVILTPGNHDAEAVWYLSKTLNAYYNNNPNVVVDVSPRTRKYYRHGKVIVGLEHGDVTRKKNIGDVMAKENPDISWTSHPHREFHLGHLHQEISRDVEGVIVRTVTSPVAPDEYHVSRGYVLAQKGVQAFVFDKEEGLSAILYHRVQYPE